VSNRMKPSRLLNRLNSDITYAKTPLESDLRRAERAGYLARLGKSAEACSEIEALRKAYAARPSAEMSAWLNLAQGLVDFFGKMSRNARGYVLRSHALSNAASLTHICALSAAWLAHLDYQADSLVAMGSHLSDAFRLSTGSMHDVRSRACLVAAQALHSAARFDLARPWYLKAHQHATAEGDDATISALMHNMAWRHAYARRAEDCGFPASAKSDNSYVKIGAESVANFDAMIGSTSWPSAVPVLTAQILTVEKEYSRALSLFEIEIPLALDDGLIRMHADFLVDQAWCRFNVGQLEQAVADANLAADMVSGEGQCEDPALAHSRLGQVYGAMGIAHKQEFHFNLALVAWKERLNYREILLKETLTALPGE
jgi:hypothetical protein